jgi:RluA family pseudouridine synthase
MSKLQIWLSSPETSDHWEIPVLYEDDQLLALNKPAGLPTTPDKFDTDRASLLGLIREGIAQAKPWATARDLSFLMSAHRLDSEASGVLLLARSKTVLTRLLDFFGSERSTLVFVALVQGDPAADHFSVEAKVAPHPTKAGLVHVNAKHGKRSRTDFKVLERFRGWALLGCTPSTHRLHQIRVHLAHANLRVAGDKVYGGKALWLSRLKSNYQLKPGHSERPLIGSTCLHAEKLALSHPVTGEPLSISAPWPKDLLVATKYLRKHAAL